MLVSATTTTNRGEQGYAVPNFETSSYSLREKAGDITSTNALLWTVPAGAYLAQMGPHGMREIGETIIANTHYAKQRLEAIKGARALPSTPFMELVVYFDESGKRVEGSEQGSSRPRDLRGTRHIPGIPAPRAERAVLLHGDGRRSRTSTISSVRWRRCSDDEQRLLPGPMSVPAVRGPAGPCDHFERQAVSGGHTGRRTTDEGWKGRVRERYHQQTWEKLLIYDLGSPGERGILPSAVDSRVRTAVGDPASLVPRACCARIRRHCRGGPAADHAALHETLPGASG